jgi:hypothetical protein
MCFSEWMEEMKEKHQILTNENEDKEMNDHSELYISDHVEDKDLEHQNHQNRHHHAHHNHHPHHHFSPHILSDILSSLIISIIGIEERLEEMTFRVYLVYHIHIYSPSASWSFFKRYNDFIALHQQVKNLLLFHSPPPASLPSFYSFEFPTRHWYWTRDTVIQMRTESFLNYLQRGLKIPLLSSLMSSFISFEDHAKEFIFERKQLEGPSLSLETNSSSHSQETSTHTNSDHASVVVSASASASIGVEKSVEHDSSPSSFSSSLAPSLSPSSIKMNFLPTIQLQNISELLTTINGSLLFSSLPLTAQTQRYQLGYATYRDGWNMKTLYQRIQRSSPLILLIKLLGHECLVGAYVSCPLGPPSYEFKGDSDCFVFRLCGETIERYLARVCDPEMLQFLKTTTLETTEKIFVEDHTSSDGVNSLDGSTRTSSLLVNPPKMVKEEIFQGEQLTPSFSYEDTDEETLKDTTAAPRRRASTRTRTSSEYNSTLYEFVYSTMEVIAFGGSEEFGTNAIRLSSDLSSFSSGPSDTYGSPCLLTSPCHDLLDMREDQTHTVMATVAEIEIFTAVGVFR